MSKWIEKKTPPVLPIYFAALVWLVGGIVLPLYRLWALALTALLSAAGAGCRRPPAGRPHHGAGRDVCAGGLVRGL